MDIRVSGHQINTGEALQMHASERLSTIVDKYFNRALSSSVTFGRAPAGAFRCDIVTHVMQVMLTRTGCNFGGARPWFLCPCCGRRVAILFGDEVFACRLCRGLAYEVQRETDTDRAIRRADAIRRRLRWHVGILNSDGVKPNGMRWRTYWRLCAEHDLLKGVGLAGIARQLGILEPQYQGRQGER